SDLLYISRNRHRQNFCTGIGNPDNRQPIQNTSRDGYRCTNTPQCRFFLPLVNNQMVLSFRNVLRHFGFIPKRETTIVISLGSYSKLFNLNIQICTNLIQTIGNTAFNEGWKTPGIKGLAGQNVTCIVYFPINLSVIAKIVTWIKNNSLIIINQ